MWIFSQYHSWKCHFLYFFLFLLFLHVPSQKPPLNEVFQTPSQNLNSLLTFPLYTARTYNMQFNYLNRFLFPHETEILKGGNYIDPMPDIEYTVKWAEAQYVCWRLAKLQYNIVLPLGQMGTLPQWLWRITKSIEGN